MEKLKQYRFLKKVEKMLNKPAPSDENYDGSMGTMYVGATAPRTAGYFADSAVSVRQGQVKKIAELLLEVIELLEIGDEDVEPRLVDLDVRFQELDLGLLFTDQETDERSLQAAAKRKERAEGAEKHLSSVDLEEMRSQISQWQKEQLERKRRLYKVETTVRDLGVNINDVRCRNLDTDRRAALATLKGSTASGVKMLKEIMQKLGGR